MAQNVKWYGSEVTDAVMDVLRRRLVQAAFLVEGEAKRLMATAKTGRMYRKPHSRAWWRASAPGEAPARRTGALASSITHDEPHDAPGLGLVIRVGTDEPYAKHLELGTSKMAPRPFLRPALDNKRKNIVSLFGQPIAGTEGVRITPQEGK